MRTTITLDNDVFQAAQALAVSSGQKLGRVISELARRGLRAKATPATRHGLPVFRVPANAPVIPSTRARDLLAEDAT
jgi:hypothetical protein